MTTYNIYKIHDGFSWNFLDTIVKAKAIPWQTCDGGWPNNA